VDPGSCLVCVVAGLVDWLCVAVVVDVLIILLYIVVSCVSYGPND
jgi:hypothetical protein